MKLFLYTLSLSLLVAACSAPAPGTKEAKEAKLEELLKEQSRLAVEITRLQHSIDTMGVAQTSTADKPKAVTVGTVSASVFKHYVDVQGQVTSNDVVAVNAKVPGTLTAVYVTEGTAVKQGQILARIDNSVAQSSLKELETSLEVAEDLFARQKALWEQKIGSEVQYINAKASRDGLQRSIATIKAQLAQTVITAPISGTIDVVNARVGEASQHPMGLFKIVNLGNLKVTADVAEAYVPYLKTGSTVEVEFPELNKTLQGKLSFVSASVNPTSRTVTVEAKVPTTQGLRPNMIAKVRVNDQTFAGAITIDQNLVQTSERGDIVYIVVEANGKKVAQGRKVETGLTYNGRVQIKSGLKAGDQLITLGYQDVSEGQAIAF